MLSQSTDKLSPQQVDWLVNLLTTWVQAFPMVSTLLILIGIDVVSGLLVAISQQKLNSTTSWRGMSRKIVMVLLVGVGAVLTPFANGLPLANITAMFFIATEGISILENAAALGVPIPSAIVDVLAKMKAAERERADQKVPISPPSLPSPPEQPKKSEP